MYRNQYWASDSVRPVTEALVEHIFNPVVHPDLLTDEEIPPMVVVHTKCIQEDEKGAHAVESPDGMERDN